MERISPRPMQRDKGKTDVAHIRASIESKRLNREKNGKLNELIEERSRFFSMAFNEYKYPMKAGPRRSKILNRFDLSALRQSLLNTLKSLFF